MAIRITEIKLEQDGPVRILDHCRLKSDLIETHDGDECRALRLQVPHAHTEVLQSWYGLGKSAVPLISILNNADRMFTVKHTIPTPENRRASEASCQTPNEEAAKQTNAPGNRITFGDRTYTSTWQDSEAHLDSRGIVSSG